MASEVVSLAGKVINWRCSTLSRGLRPPAHQERQKKISDCDSFVNPIRVPFCQQKHFLHCIIKPSSVEAPERNSER